MIDDKETTAALESIRVNQAEILDALETLKTAAEFDSTDIDEIRKRQLKIVFDLEAITEVKR